MKSLSLSLLCMALTAPIMLASSPNSAVTTPKKQTPKDIKEALNTHHKGAIKLSLEQDDLSADVQDLIDEQTDPKVIELLTATEEIMAESTDLLENHDTNASTIAVQTEIIEKIFDAAKKKKQGSGQGSSKNMDSMLEMLQNMMEGGKDVGKKPGEGKSGQGEGGGGGGKGSGSGSGKTNSPDNTAENSTRRVPKNSGNSSGSLPREFQKAMDAYNKGVKR